MKTITKVAGASAFIIAAAAFKGLSAPPKSNPVQGLVISRENFNAGCIHGATQGENGLDNASAQTYCDCVYTKGIEHYGGEQFTKEAQQLEVTQNLTPELNTIVNECIGGLITYPG